MKESYRFGRRSSQLWVCVLLLACLVAGGLRVMGQAPPSAPKIPPPPQWPAEMEKDGTRLVVYQPQLQDWQKFRVLTSDSAISLTPKGGKPLLGVASWRATTLTDMETRIVVIKDSELTGARFPSLDPCRLRRDGTADTGELSRTRHDDQSRPHSGGLYAGPGARARSGP